MVRSIKTLVLAIAFSAGSFVLVGCTPTTPTSSKPSGSPATKSSADKVADAVKDVVKDAGKDIKEGAKGAMEKAKEVGKDAADGAAALLAKAKEAFTGPITAMLGTAEKDLSKYEEDAKTAKDDAKKGLIEKATKGKEIVAKIKEKLTALTAAPGDKWEAIKTEIEKLVTDLKAYLPGAAPAPTPVIPPPAPAKN